MLPEIPGTRLRWIEKSWWPLVKGVDLVHGTDVRVPNWKGVAQVATLHDLFAHVSPDFADEEFRAHRVALYKDIQNRAARIIAVSKRTKSDLCRYTDFPEDRVDVVHEGIEARFQPATEKAIGEAQLRLGVKRPYLLYVGELSARKNLVRLVQAYSVGGFAKTHQLVLAGKASFKSESIQEEVRRLKLTDKVLWTGFVDDEYLPALYSGADAFCFPTLYEGFGLPVLESMACGTAVVGGNVGAVPEISAGHADLANPLDVDDIAFAISRALDRNADQLRAARAHAGTFTWDRCAEETLAVYRRALGGPQHLVQEELETASSASRSHA
ncbi:MAG: glycosyltransferase family 1 protein [Planctomycetota bacterium]